MIRRLAIPAVATCAALAVGIALGTGPLNDSGQASPTTSVPATSAQASAAAAFGQKWAAQAGSAMYAGKLAGRGVSVVSLPGASASVVQSLADGIEVAKGRITSHVSLSPTVLDPSQRVLVDSLASRFAAQSHGAIGSGLSTYARIGEVVGLAVNGPDATTTHVSWKRTRHGRKKVVTHTASAASRTTAQETLTTAKLGTIAGGSAAGSLVLVVLGSATSPTELGQLLDGIAAKTSGIVLVGDTSSATKDGTLAAYRAAKHSAKVLTVDGDETAYGRTAAVLGLVRQLTPSGGDYGAYGTDGLLP